MFCDDDDLNDPGRIEQFLSYTCKEMKKITEDIQAKVYCSNIVHFIDDEEIIRRPEDIPESSILVKKRAVDFGGLFVPFGLIQKFFEEHSDKLKYNGFDDVLFRKALETMMGTTIQVINDSIYYFRTPAYNPTISIKRDYAPCAP
jgi:hypothetical protein